MSLSRYTKFADQLDEIKGEQIKVDNSSYELKKLGTALKKTSLKLGQKSDNINQMLTSMARVAAMAEHSPNVIFSVEKKSGCLYQSASQ